MKATIQYTISATCDCTKAQFDEWLRYELNANGVSISSENPLYDQSVDIDLGDYSDIDISQD